ncbi:MAG: DMT family transporter [Bacillota bacterium]
MTNSTSDTSTFARGYSVAMICTVVLSTTAIFIRHLTEAYHLPPLVLAFWRDAFTALALLPVLALVRPGLLCVGRCHLVYLMAYGLVLAAFNALWTLSVAANGAAVATVLVYSSAAFTAVLGRWLLKEHLSWVKLLAVALSLGGCFLVSGASSPAAWQTNLTGLLTGTASGLGYAAYSLMGRSASQRGLNPWTTLLYTFAFATLSLLVINLLPGQPLPGAAARPADLLWLGNSMAGWSILFLLAAGPTVIGFGLYNVSLQYLPSSVVNLVVTLEPAYTAVLAYFLLGEVMSGSQVGGSLLILAGVVFLRLGKNLIAGRSGCYGQA